MIGLGMSRKPRWVRLANRRPHLSARPRPVSLVLRRPRGLALVMISVLVTSASLVSFAESYRGLYLWAAHHGLTGVWAGAWPVQVDTFVAVGELALFVGLADGWSTRSRTSAWVVTLAGLAVSVAGNIGHVTGDSLAVRATAAVPPLAAASALAVGLGVLKRVVASHHREAENDHHDDRDEAPRDEGSGPVPSTVTEAAKASMRATVAAGNPWSVNQLTERFSLTRAAATKVRREVLAELIGDESDEDEAA